MLRSIKTQAILAKRISIFIDLFIPFLLFWAMDSQQILLSAGLLGIILLARLWIIISG